MTIGEGYIGGRLTYCHPFSLIVGPFSSNSCSSHIILARSPHDRNGNLEAHFNPDLPPPERTRAQIEEWILVVPGLIGEAVRDRSGIPNQDDRPCRT